MAAEKLANAWDAPVIQMFHTLGKLKQLLLKMLKRQKGITGLKVNSSVIDLVDKIIASTSTEKTQLVDLYGADPAKIDIISPGVDLSHFYPIPPDEAKEFIGVPFDKKMLLFVGRIEPLKGIKTLLQSIGDLHAEWQIRKRFVFSRHWGRIRRKGWS